MCHGGESTAVDVHHTGAVLLLHLSDPADHSKACGVYKNAHMWLLLFQRLLQRIDVFLSSKIQRKDLNPASQKLFLQLLETLLSPCNDPEFLNAWIKLRNLNCKLSSHA